MDTPILDEDRSGGLPEGDPLSSMLSFSDSSGSSSSSSMGDFTTRLPCYPKASGTRPSIGSVAHRPWEDGIPCGPRWLQDSCYDGLMTPFPGRPKTFKPVLLYHRPEESDFRHAPRFRPYCSHVPFSAYEGDDDAYCVYCHEDAEEHMRDLLHSAAVHDHLCMTGHGRCEAGHHDCPDCNCSCGFQNPLGSRIHPLSSMKPSTTNRYSLKRSARAVDNLGQHCHGVCSLTNDAFPYPFPIPQFPTFLPQTSMTGSPQLPFPVPQRTRSHSFSQRPKSHPISHKIPYATGSPAINPARVSFPISPENRFSMTQQPPKPYLPVFARHADSLDRGSASEIRRALLMNHPVFSDNYTEGSNSSNKFTGFHDKEYRLGGVHNIGFDDNHLARLGIGHTKAGTSISHNNSQTKTSKPGVCNVSSDIVPNLGQCTSVSAVAPSVTNPGPALPTVSQMSPLNSLMPEGSDGWQDWAGKYGSFLQLLNSPECPCPGDSNSPPLPSLGSEPPAKRLMGPGPSSLDLSGLVEQTTSLGVLTSAGEVGGTDNAEDPDDRRHKCPYCDVTCTNNGQLKGHLRVHTGERPYRCECGRAFARNEELTRHRRIHSGLRPHLCNTCGKRFGRKDHLNKHQKTHLRTSEKKTHACRVQGCQQRYTRSDALARHQWGAHGIKAKTSRIRPAAPPVPHNDFNAEPTLTKQHTHRPAGLDSQNETDSAHVGLLFGLPSSNIEHISSL